MDEKHKELDRLISVAIKHQIGLGLSDNQFGQRYAEHVGSPKTWTDRLKPRDFRSIATKIEKWITKLRRFAAEIEGGSEDVAPIDTLPIVKHVAALFQRLQEQKEDRRCAWINGVQGTGKTYALRRLRAQHPRETVFLTANETWKDSRMQIAAALAEAVNAPVVASASRTFNNALAAIKGSPLTVLIDEAHEGGVLLMKMAKTVINESRAKIIMASYPTSWRRLNNGANDAYAEAQQLLRRTIRPVCADWLGGINEKDCHAWFKAMEMTAYSSITRQILPDVRAHGNFSLMADARARMEFLADERDEDSSPRQFIECIDDLIGKPQRRNIEEAA